MPLTRPSPATPDLELTFRAELKAFLAGPDFGPAGKPKYSVRLSREPRVPTTAELEDASGAVAVSNPQEVFVLDLNQLRTTKNLSGAASQGWRFFAGNNPATAVMGHVARRPTGWRLTGVLLGTGVAGRLAQAGRLDAFGPVASASYLLRVLKIPGLNLETFWMAAQADGPDWLAPYPPGQTQPNGRLRNKEFYELSEFLEVAVELAVRRQADRQGSGG